MEDWPAWERRFNQRFKMIEERMLDAEEPSLFHPGDDSNQSFEMGGMGFPFGILEEYEALSLPLGALRRVPRYLCALAVLSPTGYVGTEHFEYWRCTGAYASLVGGFPSPIHTQEQYENVPEDWAIKPDSLPDWLTFSATSLELSDLCLLIHLGLLGIHKNEVLSRKTDAGVRPKSKAHPSIEKIVEHSYNLSTRYGFPVLEGFAGKWKHESSSKIHNKLEDWTRNTKNEATRATLSEVNHLPSVDVSDDIIEQLYDIGIQSLENPSVTFGENDIFRMMSNARGDTQHGEESYSGPATIVVTLSCLAFWDLINKKQFEHLREWLQRDHEEEIEHHGMVREMYWKPEDFYNRTTVEQPFSWQLP